MNIIIMKQLAILSFFAGVILGAVTLIPYIGILSFVITFFVLSAFLIVNFKQNNLIGIINLQEGAIFGAVIGAIAFCAFLIVLAPAASILGVFFPSYHLGFFKYLFNNIGSFFFSTIPLAIFAILLSALFNGFTGLVTAWVYELITGVKKEANQNNSIDFEIK